MRPMQVPRNQPATMSEMLCLLSVKRVTPTAQKKPNCDEARLRVSGQSAVSSLHMQRLIRKTQRSDQLSSCHICLTSFSMYSNTRRYLTWPIFQTR